MALTGNVANQLAEDEHESKNLKAKRVSLAGYDAGTDTLNRVAVDANGNVVTKDPTYDVLIATDSGDSNIQYIGKADPGSATSSAVWQIKEVDTTTGTQFRLADGDADFDNVWDNRESLTY